MLHLQRRQKHFRASAWPRRGSLARALAIAASGLLLGACGNTGAATPDLIATSTCAADSRGETYVAGMLQPGDNKLVSVKLLTADPGPPLKGNNTWDISLLDAAGAPVVGATIVVTPFMPDHGHGAPVKVVVTDKGGGNYQLAPLDLFMAGLWRITMSVTAPAGGDVVHYYFCIEG